MKRSIKTLLLLLLVSNGVAFAQAGAEKTPGLISKKTFTFYATAAIPQNSAEISRAMANIPGSTGSYINIDNGYYDLVVKPDSLIAFLPFFGRNYIPTFDYTERGFDFTSTDFTYKEVKNKNGSWTITMRPKDVKNNQQLLLNVTTSGYATLSINNNNRSSISFNGFIDEIKVPKKKKEKEKEKAKD